MTRRGYPPLSPGGGRHLVASFAAAVSGLFLAWRRGRNFRIQVAAGYGVLLLAFWLRLPTGETAVVAVAAGAVLAAEAMNTAVEVLVDLITQEYHPLARTAKDLAAGAVLLTAASALVVALFVLLPHLGAIPEAVTAAWRVEPARCLTALAIQLLLAGAAAR